MISVVKATPREDLVVTPYVQGLVDRGLSYIHAGFPLHLCGPSGVGKTTLAMHIAHAVGRPVMLLTGDDEFGSSDLVGAATGYDRRRTVDRFVRSVTKVEDSVREQWVDNWLTLACTEGLTLVYDEFTRSRPEANNVLLSVLEEGRLAVPARRHGHSYLTVHPDFHAIFTSNPEEYAGVHKAQDALLERVVTLDIGSFDFETEMAITQARSGIDPADASVIVSIVREVREMLGHVHVPTVRAAIVLATVLAQRGGTTQDIDWFEPACHDVCLSTLTRAYNHNEVRTRREIHESLKQIVKNQVALRSETFDTPQLVGRTS